MKKLLTMLMTLGILLLLAAPSLAKHHAVKVANNEKIGSYLTDTEGMTLYRFAKDTPGESACAGACIEKWPAFYRETVAPQNGLVADDFGTITRADGGKQTTFRGYPLYYWINDKAPGEVNGHGVKGVWFVIDPADFPKK